ncbi:FAD-dependent thymidylate synthase [Paludibaculum fermentans]|uniref:FAD-dependent thymidylate synthase n=2 Tax=Paludibaculum fermentans TaxID=1473598 RepID=A0A7S7NYJ8_PALFE|nr:FAD-dependent thymidylate synthase [Paludibaculum fermentans]
MPPEKLAYALARYSRSPDSIQQSIDWVKSHDSSKFLESFYFQYGHASIADLGHVALSWEGVSEIAAIEIEDEQLWDGQARSSRYQDFSRSGFVTPPGLDAVQTETYQAAGRRLLETYREIHGRMVEALSAKLPRPESMKPDAYQRNIAARAFDVARYVLFLGIPTGVGQVTSIRTLEKQIRRMRSSEYGEVRAVAEEAAQACAETPHCPWRTDVQEEALAPTLAKYVDPDPYPGQARADLAQWAAENLPIASGETPHAVVLTKTADPLADIAATLLYAVTDRPFQELHETVSEWGRARQAEVLEVALRARARRDELLREFRGGPYAFDMLIDIGAYRDMHRHRRCHQTRQAFTWQHGFAVPQGLVEAGLESIYRTALREAQAAAEQLPAGTAHYLLPFAAKGRFLFKMDFAEAEYIAKLRSGVKGHFSYRDVAWRMKVEMDRVDPELGRLIAATPPWVEDPLVR